MFPYCEGPVPHSSLEKSSVKVVRDERVLALSFAFVPVEFTFRLVLRFAMRFELLPLLLLSLVMLAMAKIKITTPIPMNTSTAPTPSNHGQTLRFCGAGGGIADPRRGGGARGGGARRVRPRACGGWGGAAAGVWAPAGSEPAAEEQKGAAAGRTH